MPRCFLGLGGNIGDVAATFAAAVKQLNASHAPVRVTRTSSIYRTAPIGSEAGDPYHNAVAEIETELPAPDLLQLTQSIEQSSGRTQTVHWGPRPLDIDILLYGDEIVDRPDLIIPHPHMWYRRFVLDPLAEIAPDTIWPIRWAAAKKPRVTISNLRQRLLVRPLLVMLSCPNSDQHDTISGEIARRFPELKFEFGFTNFPRETSVSQMFVWLNPHHLDSGRGPLVKDRMGTDQLSIPDSEDGGIEFLTSVITAATDIPEIVSGPMSTAPDS